VTTLQVQVVEVIDRLYRQIDKLIDIKHEKIEKIKTVGDTYMAGAGLPTPTKTHALDMAYFAFAFAKEIEHFNKHYKLGTDGRAQKLDYKIGISSGPIVAGVIGKKNPVYDLWGKSRVERRNKCLSQRVEKKVLHV
jgi:adenylate cyclase